MRSIIILLSAVLLISCQEEVLEFTPTEKFNSIFDNPSEGLNFAPLDIMETEEGGFLVLSELANGSIFILKVTNRGDFQWSEQLSTQFQNPVASMVQRAGEYYFMAGTAPQNTATIFKINDLNQNIEAARIYNGYRKPLAFSALGESDYLLLSFNDTTGTVLSKIQEGFAMEWARKFDELENAHQLLQAYENNNRSDFFVGSLNAGGIIYFNSLRDNGVNLTYTNDLGIETGRIRTGQRNMINSFVPDNAGGIAVNYILNGQPYFINNYDPVANDSVNLQVVGGRIQEDRLTIQKAISTSITIGSFEYVINAYTTLNGRIKLNFYDTATGNQVAIKYLGGIDPLQVIKLIPTADEGLAILSRITIAGAKERINVVKIPKSELLNLL
ncbi:hypothetical protein [Marivirga sp.]|uniref:hypothetical protein n=1 Tax=Marivirga sp. TaxID=2018662 RepID=UPI002D80B8EA|nr:hypothetical protein [Marivirga sp.]HET8861003.1 hypothetical protein [Marivirga sp.]